MFVLLRKSSNNRALTQAQVEKDSTWAHKNMRLKRIQSF